MIRKILSVLIIVTITVVGAIGAYDFAQNGVDSPLVWALEGDLAPLFWAAVFGIVVWGLMPPQFSIRSESEV